MPPIVSRPAADSPPSRQAQAQRQTLGRWITVVCAVLFTHALLGLWFAWHTHPQTPPQTPPPVQIALLRARPVAREPVAPVKAARPKPVAPRRARSAGTSDLQAVAPAAPATAPAAVASAPSAASTPAAASAAASTPAAAAGASGAQAPTQQAGEKFSLPPSADLHYDTFFNGAQNQSGMIHWETDGAHYSLVVSVPLPFVGTFTYESAGHIDAYGLAPDHYTETRGRRGSTVTTFDRDAASPHIAFSRTPNTVPLPRGAQDRFSMVMQLSSLVRGDPSRYQPGVTREFFVADNDSAEVWPIETVGMEVVKMRGGYIQALHFTRLPRREGDKRKIDVWLAPSLDWLPVRIIQTEPNGTQFELLYQGASEPTQPPPLPGSSQSPQPNQPNQSNQPAKSPASPESPAPPSAPVEPKPSTSISPQADSNTANAPRTV